MHDLGLPTAAYAMATPFGAGMGTAKCSGEPEHHQACQEYVRFAAGEVADLLRDPVRSTDAAEK